MNIVSNIKDFIIYNLYFLDQKKNIVMDGKFTKMIYSDECIILNGIYLNIHLSIYSIDKINSIDKVTNKLTNKYFIKFHTHDVLNDIFIQQLNKIELNILEYYKQSFSCIKQPIFLLKEQLSYGNVKLYKETTEINPFSNYIIKISGVWENNANIGITYKFMEVQSLFD